MRISDNPFVDRPGMNFYFQIARTRCSDGVDSTPFYRDSKNRTSPAAFPKIPQMFMLKFLAYLGSIYDPNEYVIDMNGEKFMNLWTTNDNWEMFLSLSGEHPHQYRGIIKKIMKSDLVK
jgi:hypothetical protein